MSFDNSELLNDFVVEANEHLAEIENQLLEIEANGAEVNVDLVNTVFRAIHSIKGAAGFLGLSSIGSLSHSLENVLNLIRAEELTPTPGIVDVMLKSADQLASMVEDISGSNDVDVSELSKKLDEIADNLGMPEESGATSSGDPEVKAAEDIAEQIAEIQPQVTAAQESAEEEEDEMDREIRLAFEAREKAMAEQNALSKKAGGTAVAAPPAVAPKKAAAQTAKNEVSKSEKTETKPQVESSIRVSVSVLDQLMNLAGELVLARNQLLQTVNGSAANVSQKSGRSSALEAVTAGIDQVTSELQEAIMQTRMQPIGTVFGKFPRVVRDLSSKLGKQIDLDMEGVEVEVDKTIVEAIGDPLTHLVRNSVDHGVELPAEREKRNKKPTGRICLRAYHQAGKVRIDIEDDGGGIDPDIIRVKACEKGVITEDQMDRITDRDAVRLIFHPGFSTAAQVTDISGRGVGMDVVKTNIEKLGGTVDVESVIGVGTTIRVTLPLTLAIVPSLIVESGGDRYAIPQSSIVELVRVRNNELNEKIGRVKNAEVLRLRGNLLPLVRLSDALNLDETRRKTKLLKTQTNSTNPAKKPDEAGEQQSEATEVIKAEPPRAINIVVVEATQFRYGLVVDALHESEEIVVKPLGTHLREIQSLAGATILGDGHIALILDVAGIASHRELTSIADAKGNDNADLAKNNGDEAERQMALLFTNHSTEQFAIPMSVITRIERTTLADIDDIGGDLLMRYRGGSLPLLALSRLVSCKQPEEQESFYVVVFEVNGIEIGLIAPELSDIREICCKIDAMASETIGVMGTFVLENRTTRYLNLYELAEKAHPQWFIEKREESELSPQEFKLLLVEDSSFFRRQVKKFIKSEGFQVIEAEDGLEGWNKLHEANGSIDLVVSDIEMPKMNGFELCSRLREDDRFTKLPVIALTSLSDPADVERGKTVGFNDYQVKMDKAALIASINTLLQKAKKKVAH